LACSKKELRVDGGTKGKRRVYMRVWNKANPDRARAISRASNQAYKEKHPEKVRASMRAWNKANLERKRAWAKANPEKRRASNLAYRKAHPERVQASKRVYRKAHPERVQASKRAWEKANPEKRRASRRAWDKANLEKRRASKRAWDKANLEKRRAWEKANPEKLRASKRAWAKANPEKRRALVHARRARIHGNGGTYTDDNKKELLEKFNNRCPKCDKAPPEVKLTVDHCFPIKRGGTNWPSNLQILCKGCNSSKGLQAWRIMPEGVITQLEVAF
jgi:5-methylcytosine-specific restriction endonuclease McrA